VYIGVWATWYAPSKVEYVFLKEFKEHFFNNDKLQIIYMNINRKYDKWKKYIQGNLIKGHNFIQAQKQILLNFMLLVRCLDLYF
jgi:hypothetical protein